MGDNEEDKLLAAFNEAHAAQLNADMLYDEVASAFAKLQRLRGGPASLTDKILPLAKKYGPLLLSGGGAGVLTALSADSGGFSGIVNGFLSILGMGPAT